MRDAGMFHVKHRPMTGKKGPRRGLDGPRGGLDGSGLGLKAAAMALLASLSACSSTDEIAAETGTAPDAATATVFLPDAGFRIDYRFARGGCWFLIGISDRSML